MQKILLLSLLICFQNIFSQVSMEKNKLVKAAKEKGLPGKITLRWALVDKENILQERVFVQNVYGNLSFINFVEVQVLNCKKLAKADRFGSSDPVNIHSE